MTYFYSDYPMPDYFMDTLPDDLLRLINHPDNCWCQDCDPDFYLEMYWENEM